MIKTFIMLVMITMILILAGCSVPKYLDVGPVFVTSDANDIDMHFVHKGCIIIDPCDPNNSILVGKDGRWVSNKFMEYLVKRASK
jgi:hypothetical protein